MAKASVEVVDRILNARSVAVVGASANPGKWGYMFLDNILKGGYGGSLCGINPRERSILGVPIYPSVMDIPGDIDLLVVCVPVEMVPDVIEQGIRKRAAGAALITSGYREKGRADLEEDLRKRIEGRNFRIIGPNIAGINYLPNRLQANVTKSFRTRGPIGIVSQSGSVSAILAEWAEEEGIGISGLINLGNQVDLCETDFIEFFSADPSTKVISLYLEGPKNGKAFTEILRVLPMLKPIVVMKPGKTAGGRRAALSHTASMAGDDAVFGAACEQFGLVRASDLESFYDYTKIFALMPLPEGNKVGVVSSSGGIASIVVDDLESSGLALPPIPGTIVEELRLRMNVPGANFEANPIDMPSLGPDNYRRVMEILEPWDRCDMYLFVFADPIPGIEEVMDEIARTCGKPLAVIYVGGGDEGKRGMAEMLKRGIPVYPTPERAVRSLAKLAWYGNYRRDGRDA